ncbi:MAG: hypothetical protein AB1425_05915 [Actinomycetota bacterium]
MAQMITPRVLAVALPLLIVLLGGCGNPLEDSREQANEAIEAANASIAEHNRHFERARDTYAEVKERIEKGGDPSNQKERIAEARRNLQQARNSLRDARESLAEVQQLDVEEDIKRYARLLSEAMDAQLAAEQKEIRFYEILQDDPALEDRREEALDLLAEVGEGYESAEEAYGEARKLADSNPDLIKRPTEGGGSAEGDA